MTLRLFLSAAILFSLAACNGGNGEGSDSETQDAAANNLPEILTRATTTIDLEDQYLPFALYIPDSTRGVAMVEETSYGEVSVHVGSTFHIIIAAGGDLAMKKADLEGDIMYTHEIVEEGDDYILYKSSIKDSYVKPEFHFYAVKAVGDETFEFHDFSDEGGYAETVANFMLQSVNHLQTKESKQSS